MRKSTTLLLVLLLLAFVTSVDAERVSTAYDTRQEAVDSSFDTGNAALASAAGIGSFTLAGVNIAVTGGLSDGFVGPTIGSPFTPGNVVNLRSTFGGSITSPLSSGPAQIGAQSYNLFYGGQLNFDGGMITVPTQLSRRPIIITVPATLTGDIAGYLLNPATGNPGPPVFVSPVNLTGTATLVLRFSGGGPLDPSRFYSFQSISYNFPGTGIAVEK